MRAEGTLDLHAVDHLRSGPALRRIEHDHWPAPPRGVVIVTGVMLDAANVLDHVVQRSSHELMHRLRLVTFDEIRRPAAATDKLFQLLVIDAGQNRGIADLVAIEMQDGQYRTVGYRIKKFIGLPGGCQRPRLRLAIADDTGNNQIGVV